MSNSKRQDYHDAIKAVTNDLLTNKFTSELGQKAHVERSTIENEHMAELREVVADVGRDLTSIGAVPKGMEYVGSLSIHVYKATALKNAAFATVNNTANMPYDLADAALRELTGSTMITYNKQRQKLRSGF